MKGKKILTTLVVIAMVASTMVVLNKVANIDFIEEASAADDRFGIGIWEWDAINNSFVNTSSDELYYGNDLDIQFNMTVLNAFGSSDYFLYYPVYTRVAGATDYEYNISWTKWSEGGEDRLRSNGKAVGCELDVAGSWFVSDQFSFEYIDLQNRTIYGSTGSTAWHNIVGMFWVNATEIYSVSLSDTTVNYDKNESITITVDSTSDDDHDVWVDLRKDDTGASNDEYVVARKQVSIVDGTGSWTITGANMYSYTHDYGAGTYNIQVYRNDAGAGDFAYGSPSINTGYNVSFGNQTAGQGWTTMDILNSTSVVDTDNEATYNHTTCGPFDPPEYFADWDAYNLTLEPGIPAVTFNSANEIFWNSSYSSVADEINVTVNDYDDDGMTASVFTIALWNKSNNPAKAGSTPINSGYYNVSNTGTSFIVITPNGTGNRWGWNQSDNAIWGAKGKIYVTIGWDSIANATEEWNTTYTFKLVTGAAAFKWVDDGSTIAGSSLIDGELEKIPALANVPIIIQFQVLSGDYEYWGNSAGVSEMEAAENITITGDSLFTGRLDKMPNYGTSWFSSNTWKVPIIPIMSIGGGEITITATAFNKTVKGTLAIGGTKYYNNGTVVTITPNMFNIDEEDKTLDITVQTGEGYDVPGAVVTLYYIDEDAWAETAGIRDGTDEEIDSVTSGPTPTYSMEFNTTQQTDNQTEAGLSEVHAPRNLTVCVVYQGTYGYALIQMDPNNDLEIEIGRETMMAGYPYDDFSYECTIMGTNDTPDDDDENLFEVRIYDESGVDVTDSLFTESGYYISNSFTDHYSRDADDFEDIYALDAGTYTFYGYNKTHDSRGHNATLVVDQVEVTCDKGPFIWKDDNNISATFSVRYNGLAVNGSLIIDNMSNDPGTYNKTYMNTSFDGSADQGGNGSIEVDEDDLVNGDVTIHDITAEYLPPDVWEMNITFWFLPTAADGDFGAYAMASGRVPVQVPSVTPDPMYVAVGQRTRVDMLVTGRGVPLDDIFVGLMGRGVEDNGTSGTDGIATFSIMPTSAGNISIDIGEEGRTVETVLIATNWVLDIDVPAQVMEREDFDVTVTESTSGDAIEGATVEVQGVGTATTDSTGIATFTAPEITSDRTLEVSATADGYAPDDTKNMVVVNQPKLYISIPTVTAGDSFTVKAGGDDGNNNGITVTITYNDEVVKTGITVNGEVSFKIEEPKSGTYSIKATKADYVDSETLTFKVPEGSPGFELLTLIVAIGVAFILLRRRRH